MVLATRKPIMPPRRLLPWALLLLFLPLVAGAEGYDRDAAFEISQSAIDLLAPNELSHEIQLLRAHTDQTGNRPRLIVLERALSLRLAHGYLPFFAFLSAAWP